MLARVEHATDTLGDGADCDPAHLRRQAMLALVQLVGCDDAVAMASEPGADGAPQAPIAVAHLSRSRACLERFFERMPAFGAEVARFGAAHTTGRPHLASDLFDAAERARLPLFTELMRPSGIGSVLVCPLQFRGVTLGTIALARALDGRAFDAGDVARVAPLVPLFAAAEWAGRAARTTERVTVLSPREREVATLIAHGCQSKEIARILGTSPHTVRKQTQAIFEKLQVRSRTEVALAVRGPAAQAPGGTDAASQAAGRRAM